MILNPETGRICYRLFELQQPGRCYRQQYRLYRTIADPKKLVFYL